MDGPWCSEREDTCPGHSKNVAVLGLEPRMLWAQMYQPCSLLSLPLRIHQCCGDTPSLKPLCKHHPPVPRKHILTFISLHWTETHCIMASLPLGVMLSFQACRPTQPPDTQDFLGSNHAPPPCLCHNHLQVLGPVLLVLPPYVLTNTLWSYCSSLHAWQNRFRKETTYLGVSAQFCHCYTKWSWPCLLSLVLKDLISYSTGLV